MNQKTIYRRFLVFSFSNEPQGGLDDVETAHESLGEAIEWAETRPQMEPYIFDCEERRVCWEHLNEL